MLHWFSTESGVQLLLPCPVVYSSTVSTCLCLVVRALECVGDCTSGIAHPRFRNGEAAMEPIPVFLDLVEILMDSE